MELGVSLVLESDLGAILPSPLYRELRDGAGPSRIEFSAFWRADNDNPHPRKLFGVTSRTLSLPWSCGLILASTLEGSIRRHETSEHWCDQPCRIGDGLSTFTTQHFSISEQIAMDGSRKLNCELNRLIVQDWTELQLRHLYPL